MKSIVELIEFVKGRMGTIEGILGEDTSEWIRSPTRLGMLKAYDEILEFLGVEKNRT